MKYIELIIFDLDGTLVDSRDDIANAVNFTLKKIGLKEKSISEISSYIGTGIEDLIGKSLVINRKLFLRRPYPCLKNTIENIPQIILFSIQM